MTPPESRSSKRRIKTAERRVQALNLRAAGLTFEQIGAQLGITKSAAHKLVSRALEDLARTAEGGASELRTLELERLNRMLAAIWHMVLSGHLGAIDRAINIGARRAKLLGLDEPESHNLSMVAMTLAEWRAQAESRREQAEETLDEFDAGDIDAPI